MFHCTAARYLVDCCVAPNELASEDASNRVVQESSSVALLQVLFCAILEEAYAG
jgi:hypothetical protein